MKLALSALAGICVYATLIACAIGLEALGVWLYGWESVGFFYTIALSIGLAPAVLAAWWVYEEVLS